jgi:hypothetical protein
MYELRSSWLPSSCLVLTCLGAPVFAAQYVSWQDPSKHRVQFVTVQDAIRLEVLDWGGSGRPVVLLAGLLEDPGADSRIL